MKYTFYIFVIKRLYTRSGGLRKPQKVTNNPESINRKVYWCFEHKPIKRTLVNLIFSHNELKLFSNFLNHPNVGTSLIHELSLEGPYTGFLPSNEALKLISKESLNKLYHDDNKLSEFVLNHFTRDYWLYRDLYGSSYQPWLMYNEKREAPEKITNLMNNDLMVKIKGEFKNCDHAIYLNKSKIIRPNMKCHNGVAHIVNRPIIFHEHLDISAC
ncbi:heme detoxification protein, putative [Plasmodium malariae]|uniref:Heme detoxification protein, putative n=1 Tax=Plasmodium malariae TaxID=5858 RepID=A0A1C3L1P5_PLAMA|nr:heme detoxification protein, putative [Plasmodium malariae]